MKYKLFTTPHCSSCPAVKEHMKTVDVEGELIDAATPDGRAEAMKYGIMSVPTVLFFDEAQELVATARSVNEVKKVLG